MNQEAIDIKIASIRNAIIDLYPNSCRLCSGRGGRVNPSWEGTNDIDLCNECVRKGLDPLDMTKDLIAPQYENEWGEEGYEPFNISYMAKEEIEDHYKECISPTNNEEILCGSWEGLSTYIQNLLDLKVELIQVQERYVSLLSEDIK
jgi:hypothetical protein